MDVPRILGIDYGSRRVGLAIADAANADTSILVHGITPVATMTMERRNRRSDFEYLGRVLKKYSVGEIVIGLPLKLSGEAGVQAEKVQEFAAALEQRFAIPVRLWDERLSSAEAHRLLDETATRQSRRKEVVDQVAAVLILESFLQARIARSKDSDSAANTHNEDVDSHQD